MQSLCKKIVNKQNWKEWYTSLREQLAYVRSLSYFDTIVYKPLRNVIHKNLLTFVLNQQIEILQLMVLTSIKMDCIAKDDFDLWINNLVVSNNMKNCYYILFIFVTCYDIFFKTTDNFVIN